MTTAPQWINVTGTFPFNTAGINTSTPVTTGQQQTGYSNPSFYTIQSYNYVGGPTIAFGGTSQSGLAATFTVTADTTGAAALAGAI